MKVGSIKSGLEKLLPVLEEWEAGKAAKDFHKLVELMDGYEDMTVDAFCKKAREGLEGRKTAAKSAVKSTLRQDVVDRYVATLKDKIKDEAAFDQALDEVNSDKQVRVAEMKAIAQGVMGLTPLKKSKKALIEEIKTDRAQNIRTENKFKILSKW